MKTISSVLAIALLFGATDIAAAANSHRQHRHPAADYMAFSQKTWTPAPSFPTVPAVDDDAARGSLTGGPSGGLGGY